MNLIEETKIEAEKFARKNRGRIAREFTDISKIRPDEYPISIFMAGSPGAGKTEFSKGLIESLGVGGENKVIRIDGDEFRTLLPGYVGNNSHAFQGAISLIVERIHDCVLKNRQSFILDGTFSNYEKAKENVLRSIDKKRLVFISYIYQIPDVAWRFTKIRELSEGRNIPKDIFIKQFIDAKNTVNQIRKDFDDIVNIYLIKKNFETNTVEDVVEIEVGKQIDDYVKERYSKEDLDRLIK